MFTSGAAAGTAGAAGSAGAAGTAATAGTAAAAGIAGAGTAGAGAEDSVEAGDGVSGTELKREETVCAPTFLGVMMLNPDTDDISVKNRGKYVDVFMFVLEYNTVS